MEETTTHPLVSNYTGLFLMLVITSVCQVLFFISGFFGGVLPRHSPTNHLRHPRMHLLRHPRMRQLRHPRMHLLRHPRMLLSGDLLKRLFQRSQTVWEIPDRYFVSSGMTGGRRSRLEGRDDCMKPAGMKELKIVIPACLHLRHPRMRHLRHPRMLLSGDLLKRLFKRSQTV